jgi:hypothetical protein
MGRRPMRAGVAVRCLSMFGIKRRSNVSWIVKRYRIRRLRLVMQFAVV